MFFDLAGDLLPLGLLLAIMGAGDVAREEGIDEGLDLVREEGVRDVEEEGEGEDEFVEEEA